MTISGRFIICASLSVLLAASDLSACGPYEDDLNSYSLYRAYDTQARVAAEHSLRKRNCREWMRTCSERAGCGVGEAGHYSEKDVYEAVYEVRLKDMESSENPFLRYLRVKDRGVYECISLAKLNEELRSHIASPWFYPNMNISNGAVTLEDIVKESFSRDEDDSLRPRYMIQALRAMISFGRWDEIWSVWEKEFSGRKEDDVLRVLAEPYAMGAACRLGYNEMALKYFSGTRDLESFLYCYGLETASSSSGPSKTASFKTGSSSDALKLFNLIKYIYGYNPCSPLFEKLLQDIMSWNLLLVSSPDVYRELYCFAQNVVEEGRSDNPSLWLYTASYIVQYFDCDYHKAETLIRKASIVKGSPFIHESVRALAMYLDAKTCSFDSAYETRLFKDLKWLDRRMSRDITDEVSARFCKWVEWQSWYYWDDLLRKVILGTVAPEMLRRGRSTRALQLANYGSNRLRMLLGKENSSAMTSTHFFEMADSLGADATVRYMESTARSGDEMSDFLNARSYTERNYLNDIVGTHMLRERRYSQALKYLSRLDRSFDGFLNVQREYRYDPFSIQVSYAPSGWDYRLLFARKMVKLEKKIAAAGDPDVKGMLMAEYAVGMKQSFTTCWPLTQYRYSSYWLPEALRKTVINGVREAGCTMERALAMISDPGTAARLNHIIWRNRTVVNEYKDTWTARYVRAHCDEPANSDWLRSSTYFDWILVELGNERHTDSGDGL